MDKKLDSNERFHNLENFKKKRKKKSHWIKFLFSPKYKDNFLSVEINWGFVFVALKELNIEKYEE